MKYIVLDQDQVAGLQALREAFTGEFKKYSDYRPIEIKNNLHILPLSVMEDPDLKDFKDFVLANMTTSLNIREVDPSEFIEVEI